jgi:hypothetical protein
MDSLKPKHIKPVKEFKPKDAKPVNWQSSHEHRKLWIGVSASMVVVLVIWIFSLKVSISKSLDQPEPENLALSELQQDLATTFAGIGEDIKRLNFIGSGDASLDDEKLSELAMRLKEKSEELSGEADTSEWLTYTNEEFGFSFMYPRGLRDYSPNDQTVHLTSYDKSDPQYEKGDINGLLFQIGLVSRKFFSEQDVLEANKFEDELGKRSYTKERLGNLLLFKNEQWSSGSGGFLVGVFQPSHLIYDPAKGTLASLSIQDPSGNFNETTLQILSTFKFIE